MECTVEVTIRAAQPLTEEMLFAVAAVGGAAAGDIGGRLLETTLTVTAADPAAAVDIGAGRIIALVPGTLLRAAAATCEEFDRREAEAERRGKLVGTAEAAALLGVSKQRTSTLSRREDFPAPVARLAGGPVWREADLSRFAEGWQRKAGRPAKVA